MNQKWTNLHSQATKVLKSVEVCSVRSPVTVLQSYLSCVGDSLNECKQLEKSIKKNEQELAQDVKAIIDALLEAKLRIMEYMNESSVVNNQRDQAPKMAKLNFRSFDESNPVIWFQDLEVQMKAHHLSDQHQMFATLIGFLDADQSLVVNPVTSDSSDSLPYTSGKRLLLNAYNLSKTQRLEKAFALPFEVGTDKVSQFLAKIRNLKGNISMDELEQWMIQRVLPEDVRLTLQNDKSIKSAEDLAQNADILLQAKDFEKDGVNFIGRQQWRSRGSRGQGYRGQGYRGQGNRGRGNRGQGNQGQGNQGEGNGQNNGQGNGQDSFTLCHYHSRFGAKAYKCAGTDDKICPMKTMVGQLLSENDGDSQN